MGYKSMLKLLQDKKTEIIDYHVGRIATCAGTDEIIKSLKDTYILGECRFSIKQLDGLQLLLVY